MKKSIGAVLAFGFFVGGAWAKDCTLSNEFRLARPQVLAGVLEDPVLAPLPGIRLDLLDGGKIRATTVTNNRGEYSFGEVLAGRYRIRIRYSGDPFCAPKVKCIETNCSINSDVKLNPKIKPEIVY